MKRLITTFGFIIIALLGVAQGDFSVPVGWGQTEGAKLRARVQDSSGTYQYNVIPHELSELKSYGITPVFYYAPAAVSTGVTYSQYPLDGSGDFDVARTSSATVIGESGYIQDIAANIAKINYLDNGIPSLTTEGQVTNLITYSNDFANSYWTKSGATIEGDASTVVEIYASDFSSGADGWVKGSADETATFTQSGGVANLSVTVAGTNNLRPFISNTAINPSVGINLFELNYSVNSGTCVLKRIVIGDMTDYTSRTLSGLGTLTLQYYVPSGTDINLYFDGTQTFDLDINSITLTNITGYPSPHLDGSGNVRTDAYKLVESSGGTLHYINRSSIAVTSGSTITVSVFAKAGERSSFLLQEAVTGKGSTFDLSNGTCTASNATSYSITEIVDGWYKCSSTYAVPSTLAGIYIYISNGSTVSYSGDGTSGIYIYGANLTETSYPASYIATEGSTATATIDVVSLDGLQTNSILGSTTGFIMFEVDNTNIQGADTDLWLFKDTGGGSELALRYNSDETWQWYDHHSSTLIGSASSSETCKIAITWNGTTAVTSVDGSETDVTLSAAFDAITDITTSNGTGNTKAIVMGATFLSDTDINNLTR